ncbi:MAG: hypothetical protein LBQ42_03665 [Synergistaceae bacterium]|nr:hypothetical protein [Synergistaceae bacterium]
MLKKILCFALLAFFVVPIFATVAAGAPVNPDAPDDMRQILESVTTEPAYARWGDIDLSEPTVTGTYVFKSDITIISIYARITPPSGMEEEVSGEVLPEGWTATITYTFKEIGEHLGDIFVTYQDSASLNPTEERLAAESLTYNVQVSENVEADRYGCNIGAGFSAAVFALFAMTSFTVFFRKK